jgi:hypothetical protein
MLRKVLASILFAVLPLVGFAANMPIGPPVNQYNVGRALWPLNATESGAGITWAQINPYYNYGEAQRYQIDATGATDSTAAMIRAHSTGYLIHYPVGTYKVSSGVTIACGGITGDGANKTVFSVTDTASANVFTFQCAQPGGLFKDFSIQPATTKTGGYGIVIQPLSGEQANTRFEHIYSIGMPNGISFVAASQWSLHASNFLNCTGDCVTVNNTNNADSGDSVISDTVFNNSTSTTAIAVHQIASGGLKIIGSKFNNGGVGYELDLGTAGSTSILLITGCSIENAHFSGIQFQRTSGTRIFSNIAIVGNEIAVNSTTLASTGIFAGGTSNFLTGLTITGNTFIVRDTGASASAISLNWINGLLVEGNTITGAGGSSQGISFGANNTNHKIGPNQISSVATTIQPSGATPNIVGSDYQASTVNVTTSTAQGALFNGTGTFTFTTPYDVSNPPRLGDCNATITGAGTGGGISAYVTSVTNTAVNFAAAGTTNGGIVPVRVSCVGTY